MENGETVIGMLRHVIIGLRYRSRECTPSWAGDNEEVSIFCHYYSPGYYPVKLYP